jgi:hypothetical protein
MLVRICLCVAMIAASSVANAQIVDPWADPPPPPPPPKEPPTPSPVSLKMRRDSDWIAHPAPKIRPHRVRARERPVLVESAEVPQPPRSYPYEVSARPLVLPPGVTELGLAYTRRSVTLVGVQSYDTYGNVMDTRVSSQTPDIYISHAFARAELGIGVGQLAYAWAAIDTQSVPSRVSITAAFSGPQPDDSYGHTQEISISHKVAASASTALTAGVSADLHEVGGPNAAGRFAGTYLDAAPAIGFDGQVSPGFALSFGAAAVIPLSHSVDVSTHAIMAASARMTIAFDTWDIVVGGSIANPTERAATTFVLGLRKRWGLQREGEE